MLGTEVATTRARMRRTLILLAYAVGAVMIIGILAVGMARPDLMSSEKQFPNGWKCRSYGKGVEYCSAPTS